MSPKSVLVLAIAATAALMCPFIVPISEAADAETDGFYVSQLDAEERALYGQIEDLLRQEAAKETPSATVTVQIDTSVRASDEEAAKAAVQSVVDEVLSAMYLTDPSHIWLWDLPVKGAPLESFVVEAPQNGIARVTASFTLAVPSEFGDNPDTPETENRVAEAIAAVKEKVRVFEGTVDERVSAINDELRGIKGMTDPEGEVSNPYDALVSRESSSAGVAAAFTMTAAASGLDCVTVRSNAMNTEWTGVVVSYWNAVQEEGRWYAVDCTLNGDEHRNCLMAGVSSAVMYGGHARPFGGIFGSSDLNVAGPNSLNAPSIWAQGIQWPDDTPFLEKYGGYIVLAIIVVIMVAMFVHAIRTGNV